MKVLILAPHADDAELACGGTISRLAREGYEVIILMFSIAPKDVPENFDTGIRRYESEKSAHVLNVDLRYIEFSAKMDTHRNFDRQRQEFLDLIINMKLHINPDMALIPCSADIHQDHQVIHAEGVRGLKGVKTILGYDTPWNHMINGNYFVPLRKEDVEKKIDAIACYESIRHKPYANPEFIWAWAKFRGLQAGSEYAEVYEMIRGEM
jgi:hypothetical protein